MIELIDGLKIINSSIKCTNKTQKVSIFDAVNRVLAQDLICVRNLPPFNNSAMDGYGVKLADTGKNVKIANAIFAGDSAKCILEDGFAIKIMTGALVPNEVQAVVPFENAIKIDELTIQLPSDIKNNANIRFTGEEIKTGNVIAKAGTKITPAIIGLAASQGIVMLEVAQKPRVAIISSGNEVVEPWNSANAYQIYNTNTPMLYAYCKQLECNIEYITIAKDSLEDSIEFFANLKEYDLILTSGGISVGEADFIYLALKQCGFKTLFEKVNIKPGKPTICGILNNSVVLALPGNPLAASVNFALFGQAIIAKITNQTNFWPKIVKLHNKIEFKTSTNRTNVILGAIQNGDFIAYNNGKYGSGMITPMADSCVFAIVNPKNGVIEQGMQLNVIIFDNQYSYIYEDLITYV